MQEHTINRIVREEIIHHAKVGAVFFVAALFAVSGFIFFVWRNYIRRSTGVCAIASFVFGWLAISSLQEIRRLRLLNRAQAIMNPREIVSVRLIRIEKKLPIEMKFGGTIPPNVSSIEMQFTLQNGNVERHHLRPRFVRNLTRELLLIKPALAHAS